MLKLAGPKIKASNDYDYAGVRYAAARALAQGWCNEAQPILRDWAGNHEAANGRIAALQVTAESWRDDSTTLPFLQDRATNDPEAATRSAALQAIGRGWLNVQALAFLQNRMTNDPEAGPRRTAMDVLC